MSNTYDVVIYGASGYTGKLIAWHLAEDNIPFIAAGRSLKRLEDEMKAVPECKGHDYICEQVDHNVQDLVKLFTGKKIVYNLVGPFMQLGETTVQACLEAGCHYFDTTGEPDWMTFLRDKYGDAFEKKGLILCPATSYMWTSGLIASEIALETPGVDSLDVLYFADSDTSIASTKSFLTMCTKDQYFIERGEMVKWPRATSYDAVSPDSHRVFKALPWGGGGEPIWFEKDSRVNNCAVMVALRNQETYEAIMGVLVEFEEKYSSLSTAEQEAITNEIGGTITPTEPAREIKEINRHVTSCVGRGNMGGVRVVLRGNSPYAQTGALASESCRRTLAGKNKVTGFASPTQVFGARELAASISEKGYMDWSVSIV